ncbi:MAG: tRNA pseudouridine(38-40) synthase TruA [Opitutales bacterium]
MPRNAETPQRFKAWCAYDGTDFAGWQSQPGGNTIQDHIEARLAQIFKTPVRIHGSGRTDSGVHARGQVFHFDAPAPGWPHVVEKLERALRIDLPSTIQVWRVRKASPNFHGRFNAVRKRYTYRLYEGHAPPMEQRFFWSTGERIGPLDTQRMHAAAQLLVGTHDFSAFGATRGDGSNERENPVKDLQRLDLRRRGPRLTLTTEASGYLYKMVRSLTGALVEVGRGKLSPDELVAILRAKKRIQKIPTAPARGLCLERVWYR